MKCRGIKGATTADANTEAALLSASRELLEQLVAENEVSPEDVAAMYFTCSPDLTAAFPARVARELGFQDVPLLGAQEVNVSGALQQCIRILLLVNTERGQNEIVHIYLRGATVLRPEYARKT
jgi:chorismate mutase